MTEEQLKYYEELEKQCEKEQRLCLKWMNIIPIIALISGVIIFGLSIMLGIDLTVCVLIMGVTCFFCCIILLVPFFYYKHKQGKIHSKILGLDQ